MVTLSLWVINAMLNRHIEGERRYSSTHSSWHLWSVTCPSNCTHQRKEPSVPSEQESPREGDSDTSCSHWEWSQDASTVWPVSLSLYRLSYRKLTDERRTKCLPRLKKDALKDLNRSGNYNYHLF
jgi:hypothetical protein